MKLYRFSELSKYHKTYILYYLLKDLERQNLRWELAETLLDNNIQIFDEIKNSLYSIDDDNRAIFIKEV